jgi:hypothetical protein
MRTLLFPMALLAAALVGGVGQAREIVSYPSKGVEVTDTFVGPMVGSIAWVLQTPDGARLYVDGEELAQEEDIDQIHLTSSGAATYWASNGEHQVVVYRGEKGPEFNDIHVPDLEVLAGLATPEPTEYSFLGGTRVAFAARDRNGQWTALLRFPAAWQNQEKRPLPVTRLHYETPDPTSRTHRPLRYRLLRGKVPIYIGSREREECLVIGRQIAACGKQVSMMAVAPDLSQAAFGILTPQGIEFHSAFGVIGPTSNVDWVSFSPDGNHLASIVRQGAQQALIVDGIQRSVHEAAAAAVWLPDNRLLTLEHNEAGSQIAVDGQPLLEKKLIERLFVSPDGRVLAVGKDDEGPFLDPLGRPGEFTSIWGEGFLSSGTFFGLLRLPGGKVSLLNGKEMTAPFSGISRVSPAPDGKHLVAVGASVEGDAVLLDGEPWEALSGRVERFAWCGGDKLQVMVRGAEFECLLSAGVEQECCPRFVATGCDAAGRPAAVCLKESRYIATLAGGPVAVPFEDVPLHLVFQDLATGALDFAGRVGDEWTLVFSGQTTPAAGKPIQAHPGPGGASFMVQGSEGFRWVSAQGATEWFDAVSSPMDHNGHSFFRARRKGQEAWADIQGTYGWHDAILSTLYTVDGGGFYWARDGERIHLDSLEY